LETCLEFERALLDLRPPGHQSRYRSLNSLAECYRRRFNLTSDVADLDRAIVFEEEEVTISTQDRPADLWLPLNALSRLLRMRYD
ncbi:hypothetical protein PAXINDRAFT_44463, partial [Paxillus involutus ATCC 200175]